MQNLSTETLIEVMSIATTPILKANPLLLSLKQKQKKSFFLPLSSSLVRFTKLSASTNCSTNNTQLYNSRLLSLVNNKKSHTEIEIPTLRAGAKIVNEVVDVVYKKILMGIKVSIVTLLLGLGLSLVMFGRCNRVMAASCGRMGGYPSSSSTSSSSSCSSSSSIYVSSSNWSGGGYPFSIAPSTPQLSPEEAYLPFYDFLEEAYLPFYEFLFYLALGFFTILYNCYLKETWHRNGSPTSVLMIQVATSKGGQLLRRHLNQICENADTSSLNGLSKLFEETLMSCFKYLEYWSSSYSYVHVKKNTKGARKFFKKLSKKVRGRSEEETLTNVNDMREKKKKSVRNQRANGFNIGYTMVTILVAVEGVHELPTINGKGDLEKALQKLYSIKNKIQGVEVLWTPQYEDETLSEKELLEQNPFLRPLYTEPLETRVSSEGSDVHP